MGGTFTDVVLLDDSSGEVWVDKVPTTYPDIEVGVLNGLRALMTSRQLESSEIALVAHGTTIGTNALIERKGAHTALVTTRGFRDVLELKRGRKPSAYDFNFVIPPPLVPRPMRYEVDGRLDLHGIEIEELTQESIDAVCRQLAGYESVAICLLFSFENPEHERRLARAVRAARPEAFVACSSDVDPHPEEFERTSTTVLNAYLGPLVGKYLDRVRASVIESGLPAPMIMQSNGGLASVDTVRDLPISLLSSGPSGAVVVGRQCALMAGEPDVIICDMGGTSFDVTLVVAGEADSVRIRTIDQYPIRAPMIDTRSVGAGGGSIAWVDAGGSLRVGPESARSVPGPACYGRGGSRPTVTDADLLLGHFPGDSLMAGAMGLDRGAAMRAVDEQVAGPLGMSTTEAAAGILRIVDARMADAIRVGISGRGLDPRDFALVVGGGAGPLHVSRIARELGIARTIIPEHPGTMSAYGVAVTDRRHEASISLGILLAEETREDLAGSLRNLKDDVTRVFASEGVPAEQLEFNESVDLRYVSERGDIQVRIQGHMDTAELAVLQKEFSRLHEGVYGFTGEGQNIVIVR
ncbi:MAG TPA: hydantoinase/oxoprolinase family protein, partial [Acidimicrobiales bacterium]|nr:hydantoinase/oxoprolinase family protein [Acidimicrobiales bacterium]